MATSLSGYSQFHEGTWTAGSPEAHAKREKVGTAAEPCQHRWMYGCALQRQMLRLAAVKVSRAGWRRHGS